MLRDFFATKLGMTQAWTATGKRLAVTRCQAGDNLVVGKQTASVRDRQARGRTFTDATILEIGHGQKKLNALSKPLRSKFEQGGFSIGAKHLAGVRVEAPHEEEQAESEAAPAVGSTITVQDVLEVGDVVQVQGTTKGRGFAGAMKRHGFKGGPATHGQSDRERAVGSIGAGTTPGRVWKGKRMPGHYGDETATVTGLVVLHIDPETKEVWLSGPVPGSTASALKIRKTGKKKEIELDRAASGLPDTESTASESTA